MQRDGHTLNGRTNRKKKGAMHLKQILSSNVRSETFSVNKSKTIKETRNFDWV